MTELLDRAFNEASRLPAADQDAFARSPQALAQLASEARAEYQAAQADSPKIPNRRAREG